MLLAIDCGNTNTVFAVYDGENLRGEWRATTNAKQTADEYAVWLTQLMTLAGIRREEVTGAIIANVVPAALFSLTDLCRRYFKCEPLVVGEEGVDLGLEVLIERPGEVGADTLVNAVAVHERYPGPVILIDFGTATTFDVIDENGNYCGGLIAPGVNLSVDALHMAAARLPRIGIRRPKQVIGKATVPAMESGVFWGYIGLIEGLVTRIIEAYGGGKLTVVATGGLAPLFADATGAIDHLDPDLTLRGLAAVYRRNRPS